MSQLPIKSSELIAKFKPSKLPISKLPKDFLIHQDIVFNSDSTIPVSKSSNDFANSFLAESKKFNNYNNHPNPSSFGNNFQKGKNAQKIDEESNDFFDNFKGKFNPKDVSTFKRNAEMLSRNALNIQYTKRKLVDLLDNKSKKGDIVSIDDFFGLDDTEPEETSKSDELKDKQVLQTIEDPAFVKSNTFLTIEIPECIYSVNERLGYPKDKPLWYIYHESAESSYGPLSSKTILEMLSIKLLTIESKIRFIDIFVYRGCPQFNFFNIKDIRRSNFHDNIRVSEFAKLAPISIPANPPTETHKEKDEGLNKSSIQASQVVTSTQKSIYDIPLSKSQAEADFFDHRKREIFYYL